MLNLGNNAFRRDEPTVITDLRSKSYYFQIAGWQYSTRVTKVKRFVGVKAILYSLMANITSGSGGSFKELIVWDQDQFVMEQKYQRLREIAQKELSISSHDMEHVMRVYNLCIRLSKNQPDIDMDIVKTAALLHDIARVKENNDKSGKTDHAILGAEMAESTLRRLGWPAKRIELVKDCIATHRFRSENRPRSKEAKILFDADKLDVIGAVGIARSFMIAGEYSERIYADVSVDEYAKDNLAGGKRDGRIRELSKHAPNLEYETKFRHIPRELFTPEAKNIARARVEFMRQFFKRLRNEICAEA
jgi:uncharacterized protein